MAWIPRGEKIEIVPLSTEISKEFRGLGRGKSSSRPCSLTEAEERER